MSFQPVLPLSGYTGWRFLSQTLERQTAVFAASGEVAMNSTYFRDTIAKIQTPEDLLADRRLLSVALGAFGLQDDLNAKAFIKRVLVEGTDDKTAFANKLSDKRYAALANAFGFGNEGGARTADAGFADTILARYTAESFELAVGEQDNTMRLALNLSGGISDVMQHATSDSAQWFAMMGDSPLRSVFETALGFPTGFGQIDIDQQKQQFMARAKATFGVESFADFTDPAVQEKLIRLFMLRSEMNNSSLNSPASVALKLLGG
ncbi:DUF1217 domain-containing protein [Ketogulonicigenium vulgare]|uniref:Flagellar protein, putative n=1 Tax=Ketogulonicigenium vulgare (strain WSH-001) TaxID=759362 RepID=F9Y4F4_KETVW|nr:DUF1217 domain-containing protein [Ketogulonicigenium vulgare]ADO43488.1 flagellar protein, putative [Ketogulonicigenium vulgare Y25]AEM41767.1 Flagellar protein, putative [Ketogulonicigenium vulgare WSH-001]ALJ81873.1 flagellar protein [Ketogulonicigenium vulgare]ANW34524.1 flagellar protein [Ketogulonicigenium vulgare]AOZ55523.1 flagellar protein [Ketogulonicigenium vulgare]